MSDTYCLRPCGLSGCEVHCRKIGTMGLSIEKLSRLATQGVWEVRNRGPLGSDLYVTDGGSFIGSFRSNGELPDRLLSDMLHDAELSAALVNAYRAGRLVEKPEP